MSKINRPVIYSRFNLPKGKGVKCTLEEGKTHQSFKDECNINVIVEKYTKSGLWSETLRPATNQPMFGDFTNAPDFRECMTRIAEAQADFDALPSSLRKRFSNSPVELLNFVSNASNREEAILLGLIQKKAPESAAGAPEATPPAAQKTGA